MRETDVNLVEFCAAQYHEFDAQAWVNVPAVTNETLAAAAWFLCLSAQSWYGHTTELEKIVQRLNSAHTFTDLVKTTRFDYLRFSSMLKMRLRYACALS